MEGEGEGEVHNGEDIIVISGGRGRIGSCRSEWGGRGGRGDD